MEGKYGAADVKKSGCSVGDRSGRRGRGYEVCPVCPHHCLLKEGQYGRCGARKNEDGRIICANYGMITSLALDPMEKKPLSRFFPGSMVLSTGSFGCNLSCSFCQNHEISMAGAGRVGCSEISARELAELAKRYESNGNIGVAFTYNEPLVGYEFVRDVARLVHGYGMKSVMVTNGFAELWVLDELLPHMDAMNIDLKGFTEEWYEKLGGRLDTVKSFIKRAAAGCHVELTTLIVPGENDSQQEMEEEARWIASIDEEIPLHITRFFPRYEMRDRKATDVGKIYGLKAVAEKYLKYVYAGNC